MEFITRAHSGDHPLEVKRSGDGRTLTGYVAVFNKTAEIHDQFGDYVEQYAPNAFDKTIAERGTSFRVMYNHGLTMFGTPSERFAIPIGVPKNVTTDAYGVLGDIQLNRGDLEDTIIEGVHAGSIRGMSFYGRFLQSDPRIPRFGFRASRSGELPVVTHKEVAMREFGPTATPAFDAAAIIGVRALFDRIDGLTPDERSQLIDLLQQQPEDLTATRSDEPVVPSDTATDVAVTVDEPVPDHSARRQVAWNNFRATLIERKIKQ